jgi:hypothetical protein
LVEEGADTLGDPMAATPETLIEEYRHGFHDSENYAFKSDKGLTREIVERISSMKNEPAWMREFRLNAYDVFRSKPMPTWGDTALLNEIDFDNIHYFVKPASRPSSRGTTSPTTSSAPSTGSGSPKRSASSSAASRRSTSPKSSTTPSSRSSKKTA